MTPHDRPWMTAIEMQFATLRIQRHILATPNMPSSITDPVVSAWLPTAVPFAWTADTAKAVWLASRTIPMASRWTMDMIPEGAYACWWWFAAPLPIPLDWQHAETNPEEYADIDIDHVSGLLIGRNPSGAWICDARQTTHGPMCFSMTLAQDGATLGELLASPCLDAKTGKEKPGSQRGLALLRFIMAACVWLQQRIAVVGPGHIERHRRKQLAREHGVPIPSEVKVVELRRYESVKTYAEAEAEPVDWSCRWIVGGHWRNQPYANGETKLIYIMPFVKGPADKPLRVPATTAYVVNR